jgi:hypothetical protein
MRLESSADMNGSQVRRSRFDGKYHALRARRKRAEAREVAIPQFDACPMP